MNGSMPLGNGDTKATEKPLGAAYAILSTKNLAAALETNSIYDYPKDASTKISNGRIKYQFTKNGDLISAGLWSGQ